MPGQSAGCKLDPGQTRQMIRFAVPKPAENANSIVHEGLSLVGLANIGSIPLPYWKLQRDVNC
jgi:hypothetical protein